MPQILYDHTRINVTELLQHSDLINNILSRTLRYPNVKKLAGSKYNNEDVFRAKTDKKNRLIYTYILHNENKTLLILALNDHNYGQVKRQLRSKNPGRAQIQICWIRVNWCINRSIYKIQDLILSNS